MKLILRSALFRAVYETGKRLKDGGITILSYHSIDEHGTAISVSPGLFETHMAALASEGCPTFTMAQVYDHLSAHRPFPPRAVAITFDDGFANVATVAAPIMQRHGLTATIYVITGMIGRTTQWTAYGSALPSLRIMTWEQIEALHSEGFEIGAHTITHGFLTHYSQADLEQELREPKATLEQRLGTPIRSFAYPQGDYNPQIVTAVRVAGYGTAATIDQGRASHDADPFRLPRLHVGGNTTPTILKAFTTPAVGPTYRLINVVIRHLMGRKTWPRPDLRAIQSTQTVQGVEQP